MMEFLKMYAWLILSILLDVVWLIFCLVQKKRKNNTYYLDRWKTFQWSSMFVLVCIAILHSFIYFCLSYIQLW